AAAVRSQALSIDSNQPVFQIKTMNRYLFDSVAGPRFNTILVNVFAGLAMAMAIVGIYGILSYAVSQRTHEIGIRMALGASRVQVLRLIVGQAMLLVIAGGALGVAIALAVGRLLSAQLFGITARDPLTLAAVCTLLLAAALIASFVPAYRGTKIDPMM